ncbi:MAG: NDP-hexose 2,3-dehydratase family protein [Patescibacteria group bacterium]|jgi:hypothetical protein|nr:NDP-hexose 2,3-dehydratase family protein [Patescibacteria group bacterium]
MGWKLWLDNLDKNTRIKVIKKKLSNIYPWKIFKCSLRRLDNLFFKVNGYSIKITTPETKNEWNQVLMQTEDPIHGWLILVVAEEDQAYFLLSARAEAGWGSLGLGPTFQASKSNLFKNPNLPRKELINDNLNLILQDGGVYFNKRNYAGVQIFGSRSEFEEKFGVFKNERWFTEDEFFQAMKDGKVSDHLLQAKACYRR